MELVRVVGSAPFEFRVDRDSSGRPIDLTHSGVVSRVEVASRVVRDIAAEDVRGVVLATAADTPIFSPLAVEALRHFPEVIP